MTDIALSSTEHRYDDYTTEDLDRVAAAAAPSGIGADMRTHSLPILEGEASRRHERRSARVLRLSAAFTAWRRRADTRHVTAFLQFVGFPRSGHSLVGALVDAHPNAAISHEMDALGLFAKGVGARHLPAFAIRQAEAFGDAGRWWNGMKYDVPGAPPPGPILLAGDKKGDWASRWAALDPELPGRLRDRAAFSCPFVLVTRHPLDNISTMTLRLGRTYDRLRIDTPRAQFGDVLRRAQGAGEIPDRAADTMIDDYEALCASTEAIMRRTPASSWHAFRYEDFTAEPAEHLERLAAFLDLPADPRWVAAGAQLVHRAGRSRDKIAWTADQHRRVGEIIGRYSILKGYIDAD